MNPRFIIISLIAVVALVVPYSATAADDPTIAGAERKAIQESMRHYIRDNTVADTFYVFDAVEGKLLRLNLEKLHDGIVRKDGFFVSCADFRDQNGRLVDIDFLVVPDGSEMQAVHAVVHAVDGKKRPYHLEG